MTDSLKIYSGFRTAPVYRAATREERMAKIWELAFGRGGSDAGPANLPTLDKTVKPGETAN